jgi:hypothetical protein
MGIWGYEEFDYLELFKNYFNYFNQFKSGKSGFLHISISPYPLLNRKK